MHVTYECVPTDHADACAHLELACEGIVQAMVAEIDQWPEGTFPCCIKCGGFCTRNGPLTPAQAQAIGFTLEHGHPRSADRIELEGVLTTHGYHMPDDLAEPAEMAAIDGVEYGVPDVPTPNNPPWIEYENCQPELHRGFPAPQHGASLHVRCATQILRSKTGTTIELACYQCAQKRRHADPWAKVKIVCTQAGTFRAVVLCSPFHEKPERRCAIDDPVEDARPVGSCGCAIDHPEVPE